MKHLKYLYYLCLGSLIIGPAGSFATATPGLNIYLTDFTVGLICLYWITKISLAFKIIRDDNLSGYFFLFIAIGTLSLFLSPVEHSLSERFISSLYLLRYLAYFFVYITTVHLIKSKSLTVSELIKCLVFVGISLSLIGWLQYFLYPDLRNLYYMGWDPHYKRIFATYFDPNYLGLMLVFTIILLWTSSSPSPDRRGNSWGEVIYQWFSRIFVFITLMFTYSRSSYLALIVASLVYSIISKRIIYILVLLTLFTASILVLPRPGGEGVKLERIFSIEQRIDNWKLGVQIWKDYPILGVGFNTLRYAKNLYANDQSDLLSSHSGAGLDNSFLFVTATTGIIGLTAYLLLLYEVWNIGGLKLKLSLIAAIAHSLFLNSLFFPPVMIWLWILLGISQHGLKPGLSSYSKPGLYN